MYEDLVKDLRELSHEFYLDDSNDYTEGKLSEAADAIEELSMRLHGDEAAIAGMKREIERMVVADKPRWIPVTERLPKKPNGYPMCELRRCYYLVSLKSGCVESLAFDFDRNEWHYTGSPVIAWRPLPPPPKEEA